MIKGTMLKFKKSKMVLFMVDRLSTSITSEYLINFSQILWLLISVFIATWKPIALLLLICCLFTFILERNKETSKKLQKRHITLKKVKHLLLFKSTKKKVIRIKKRRITIDDAWDLFLLLMFWFSHLIFSLILSTCR